MRIIFCVHTPAHVHLYRNVIKNLMAKGNNVKIIARDYGETLQLLDDYKLEYQVYLKDTQTNKFWKGFQLFTYVLNEYRLSRTFKPDLIIGVGPDEPLLATILGKPCILFNDSEPIPFQQFVNKIFADVIISPSCFRKNLGRKHLKIAGYKEIAYLHSKYFEPDPSILNELKLSPNEKYVILRFNVFDAFHDVGKHGFSKNDQLYLVQEISKYAHVFISPEGNLSQELERYRLKVPFMRIHHVLYYADLLITDTQTMATEAAILGTPVVRCNNFVGPNDMGNFIELEQKYDLMYSFPKPEQAIKKAKELICQPDLKKQWAAKRQNMLMDKIDVTEFLTDFIGSYPESFKSYQNKKV